MSGVRTTSSSLVSADELASSSSVAGDSQSVDTGYVSYCTRSLYVLSHHSSTIHYTMNVDCYNGCEAAWWSRTSDL